MSDEAMQQAKERFGLRLSETEEGDTAPGGREDSDGLLVVALQLC